MDANERFKRWYATKADAHNAKRRQRYAADAKYRQKVLALNTAYRRKVRALRAPLKLAEHCARKSAPITPAWRVIPGDKILGGDPATEYYTIQKLAAVLGRSVQSVRQLEARGVIDPPPFRMADGARVYSLPMILEIRAKLKANGLESAQGLRRLGPSKERKAVVLTATGQRLECTVFTIGVLAQRCGRTVVSMHALESEGILPATPLLTPNGVRLYTASMIKAVEAAIEKRHGRVQRRAKQSIFDEIAAAWRVEGLLGPKVTLK